MSEIPKQSPNSTGESSKETVKFKQALLEFLDDLTINTPEDRAADAASRRMATDLVDAEHGLQSARENRQDIIERHQAGEDILPEVVAYTGEILIAAELEAQRARQQTELPFDNPPR